MRPFALVLVLILATGLVYFNSFPGAFHFDDFALILENPHVTAPDFRYASFLNHYGGRPLTLLTFHWNYRLFGGNPFPYHLISVLLHLWVVLAIFFLFWQLSDQPFLAFSTALIFALHPVQTQAVNYIWSRSVLLMAAFAVLAMILSRKHPWMGLICFQMAIWSRTEAIVICLLLILLNTARWKSWMALALINTAGFLYCILTYAPREIAWNHPNVSSYWMAQPVIFWKYLGLMVWPSGLSLDYDFTLSSIGISCAALAALLGLGLLVFRFRANYPIPAFSLLWLLTMFLPSCLVPNSDLFNESRVYLAFAGFPLVTGWALEQSRVLAWRRASLFLLVSLLVPVTMARNDLWKSDLALWQDTAWKSPDKARPHYNFGVALARQGDLSNAEREFRTARDLNPQDDLSYAALGYCAEQKNQSDAARRFYRKALRLNPRNSYARKNLERLEAAQVIKGQNRGNPA